MHTIQSVNVSVEPYKTLSFEQGDRKMLLDARLFLKYFPQLEQNVDSLYKNPFPEKRIGYYGVRLETRYDDGGRPEVVIRMSDKVIKLDFMEFQQLRKIIEDLQAEIDLQDDPTI